VAPTAGLAAFGGDPRAEAEQLVREIALAAATLRTAIPGIRVEGYFVDFEGVVGRRGGRPRRWGRLRPTSPLSVLSSARISAATRRALSRSPGGKLMAPTRGCPPPP